MAKPIPENELEAILAAVRGHPGGLSLQQIAGALDPPIPRRTLQYRLKHLVEKGRLNSEGTRRWTTYRLPAAEPAARPPAEAEPREEAPVPLSPEGTDVRDYLRQPPQARKPAGYNQDFLLSYRPNISAYLSDAQRAHLRDIGTPAAAALPAGTYVRNVLNRLLIDLSWNSSRLEGNTYSLLDTRRLIEFGEEAAGRDRLEAQMILNHKDAIEFIAGVPDEIGFNRATILNLHALLAGNLLPDEAAAGRLRHIPVGIEHSAFEPLAVPQLIEEYFDQILASAAAIIDPFEQGFFVMVHLPYLQPFDDVNKRVSRLAANIPLISANLSPLSFTEVPRSTYLHAMLGVYELNDTAVLKDVFIWAYERSAARYAAVRQSLGAPDPFRFAHRDHLRQLVGDIVRQRMDRSTAASHIASWAQENIDEGERERFRELAETELLSLHEGNFARYQIRPAEFAAWQQVWAGQNP